MVFGKKGEDELNYKKINQYLMKYNETQMISLNYSSTQLKDL